MEPIEFITPTDGYFCFYWSSDNYVCGQEIAGNVIDYESGNLIYDQNICLCRKNLHSQYEIN